MKMNLIIVRNKKWFKVTQSRVPIAFGIAQRRLLLNLIPLGSQLKMKFKKLTN
jgi:hypothetical protein